MVSYKMAGDEIVKESSIHCFTKITNYKGSFEWKRSQTKSKLWKN